jgi:hypothetical protein
VPSIQATLRSILTAAPPIGIGDLPQELVTSRIVQREQSVEDFFGNLVRRTAS